MPRVKKLFGDRSSLSSHISVPAKRTLRGGRQLGFTLMEVMIAATVMVLAISSSIIVLQQGLRAIDTARYSTLAGQILQSQMEKLRLLNWTQMTHTVASPGTSYGAINFTTFPAEVAAVPTAEMMRFTAGGVPSRCAQSIVPLDAPLGAPASAATMLQITLTATWKGLDGRPHSLSYVTYYGKSGLSDFFYN
ncbi:MAG: type IV pilus modification PilV family protein [Opitutaceae bacterium]